MAVTTAHAGILHWGIEMALNSFPLRPFLAAAALYALCLFAAAITELLWTIPGSSISIWFPAGILLSVLLASSQRQWPLFVIAAVTAEMTGNALWYKHDIGPALGLAVGNSVAVIFGALAIRKYGRSNYVLSTTVNTSIFLTIAGVAMPLLSATTGSIALGWSYGRPWSDFWVRIFLGDATGALIAAPVGLLLLKIAARRTIVLPARLREASALVSVFGVMAAVSLGGTAPFAYLMIPPLLWAALSFRISGAIVAIAAITLFAALFTLVGIGPFAQPAAYMEYRSEALQIFLIVVTTTGLLIGAIAEEHWQGISDLYALNQLLEDRVEERSASLAATETQARETANLLSAISEACPDQIYAKDLQFRPIYANSATLKIFNASSLEDLKLHGEERMFTLAEEFKPIRANDRKVLKTGKTLIAEEVITGPDGVRKVYRTTKSPLLDSEGNLAGLAGVSVDISDIIKSQKREKMLVREVEHRARNLLAVVQGIVMLSRADSVTELKNSLTKRIRALAHTNGAIAASNWEGADLVSVLETELAPYRTDDGSNIVATGPQLLLEPATAQSLTLIIHELTTNAAKYGCLSAPNGKLLVDWTVDEQEGRDRILHMTWNETGGPAVKPPERQGFGTTVIGVFGQERPGSSVDFVWAPKGLSVKLVIPLLPPKLHA